MKTTYNKLVRSDIPNIIASEGKIVKYVSINNDEFFKKLLIEKLQEEVNEFVDAVKDSNNYSRDKVLEEMSDIESVMAAFMDFYNIGGAELFKFATDKNNSKRWFY